MFSSNSSMETSSTSKQSNRKPLNPLLLTTSSENVQSEESRRDSEETFCSKYEGSEDLFSKKTKSSNLNDLINILSSKVSKVDIGSNEKENAQTQNVDQNFELTEFELESDNSSESAQGIADGDIISLSDSESEKEDIEVLSISSDEEEKYNQRVNFMVSSLESTNLRKKSSFCNRNRMDDFLKDVAANLGTMSLEGDTQSMAGFSMSDEIRKSNGENLHEKSDNGQYEDTEIDKNNEILETESMTGFNISNVLNKDSKGKTLKNKDLEAETQSMSDFSISDVLKNNNKLDVSNKNKQSILDIGETESMAGFNASCNSSIGKNNSKNFESDTQSMSGFTISDGLEHRKKVDDNLKETASMTGFNASCNSSTGKNNSKNFESDIQSMSGFTISDGLEHRKKVDDNLKDTILDFTIEGNSGNDVLNNSDTCKDKNHRIIPEDTESMTGFNNKFLSKFQENNNSISNFSLSEKLLPNLQDQTLYKKRAPIADTESFSLNDSNVDNSRNSSIISNSLESKISKTSLTINSTIISDASEPEASLTISETSSENNGKLSSKSTPSKDCGVQNDDRGSEEISITAKFNIKIQLSHVISTSVKDGSKDVEAQDNEESQNSSTTSKSSVENQQKFAIKDKTRTPIEINIEDVDSNSCHQENVDEIQKNNSPKTPNNDDCSDLNDSEFENNVKLLTELYGDAWKTPAIKEILISQSTQKKTKKTVDKIEITPISETQHNNSIGDFSNFYQNVDDHLDSTRLHPKSLFRNAETKPRRSPRNTPKKKNTSDLVYLDLTKEEVEEVSSELCESPEANRSELFNAQLNQFLNSYKFTDKKKVEPVSTKKSKRKLFTKQYSFEDDDFESIKPPINKNVEDDLDRPIKFSVAPPQIVNSQKLSEKNSKRNFEPRSKDSLLHVYPNKHTFLKSLEPCVSKTVAHPDALYYRDSFKSTKEELCLKLHEIYNDKVFDGELNVPITWNKKLLTTAGRCITKKKFGVRSSSVELSDKVCTSADRLRCTLIHELCHAATWNFNGEGGHGAVWKSWARKANSKFPELPIINVCHDYVIEYKYTYKCTLCGAKSHAHSKSKKVENIRCAFCHGAIEILLNKKDREGNVVPTPVKSPKGFSKFVKAKYKEFKTSDLKHAEVMKLLSNAYAELDINEKKNF